MELTLRRNNSNLNSAECGTRERFPFATKDVAIGVEIGTEQFIVFLNQRRGKYEYAAKRIFPKISDNYEFTVSHSELINGKIFIPTDNRLLVGGTKIAYVGLLAESENTPPLILEYTHTQGEKIAVWQDKTIISPFVERKEVVKLHSNDYEITVGNHTYWVNDTCAYTVEAEVLVKRLCRQIQLPVYLLNCDKLVKE